MKGLKAQRFLRCIITIWFVVLIAGAVKSSSQEIVSVGRQEFKVHGRLLDPHDNPINNSKVIFRNGKIVKVVVSGKDGEYQIALPAGIYDISVIFGVSLANYKRGRFAVSGGDEPELNVILLPECFSEGCSRV